LNDFSGAPLPARIALATLGLALAASVVSDLRSRRILNVVTFPALVVAGACAVWMGGGALLLDAALGALACAGPLALAAVRGWMGAGDVKLMAVVGVVSGAAAGWPFSLVVLLDVAVAGGVQAVLWIAAARLRAQPKPRHVPYAVAIAAGTVGAFLWG
jgi:prepilin peptidase CpaA